MAMSLGKSSSMAAVLLLVAMVAGTCASGAQAEFDITNNCSKTVVITTALGNSTLAPGGNLQVSMPPNQFFTGLVKFTVTGTGSPPVTIQIPQDVLAFLNLLGVQLQKIEVTCNGNCITILVTFNIPLFPLLSPVTLPLGCFCP